ncbi:MAG: class I SAM-dependent methyltransferase [Stagnimonas sp.]|nr:class I SAM-dependent methyltransferase [Stagnimonas sp.]
MANDPSTSGYSESAQALIAQYESVAFEDVHGPVLHLYPLAPASVLDIGAGTGRDAAALARRGHAVTAVEPTPELAAWGRANHPRSIRWIDDRLPRLDAVLALGERFDFILLTAVWMHLDTAQQREAMRTIASLAAPGGRISMTLRHGPVPEGRRMFDVTGDDVSALAAGFGLQALHHAAASDAQKRPDVSWTFLVLEAMTGGHRHQQSPTGL